MRGAALEGKELIGFASPSTQNMQPIKTWSWEGPCSVPPEGVCAGRSARNTSFQDVGLPGGMCSVLLGLHSLLGKEAAGAGCAGARRESAGSLVLVQSAPIN